MEVDDLCAHCLVQRDATQVFAARPSRDDRSPDETFRRPLLRAVHFEEIRAWVEECKTTDPECVFDLGAMHRALIPYTTRNGDVLCLPHAIEAREIDFDRGRR